MNSFCFEKSKVVFGDCLIKMKDIPDNSIDMVCCDLPYGVTKNKLDIVIPFQELWREYNRIVKPNGAIVLYAQGLFYVDLVNSNRRNFRYDLIWDKELVSGFLNARKMPLRVHEQVAIFYRKLPVYNPQMTEGLPLHGKGTAYYSKDFVNNNYGKFHQIEDLRKGETLKYPKSIISFKKPHPSVAKHRTEKSVECNEWLIKTYTNEGDVVLDNTSGSGTTGEACVNTNRNFILIENDRIEFEKGKKRVIDALSNKNTKHKVVFD